MARRPKRASMREGPLADLFRSTEKPEDPPEMGEPPRRREPEPEPEPVQRDEPVVAQEPPPPLDTPPGPSPS